VLLVVFIVWWIYAYLNDSEGRLYRWTDGQYGRTPVEVQKALDAAAADKKLEKEKTKPAVDARVMTTTNAAPAK